MSTSDHLKKAMWLFPLYLLLINIFVLPIAFAGLLRFPGGDVDADTFVLTIAMKEGAALLALLAFIGGLSAATGMIIVETVALSTMVSNDLVMPLLLRVGRQHVSRAEGPDRASCSRSGEARSSSCCCSATSTRARSAGPMRW